MNPIPLWLQILLGSLGVFLVTLVGIKYVPESKSSNVSPPTNPVSPLPDLKNVRIRVWTGKNREAVSGVEVEFVVSNGPPAKNTTDTNGYTSIEIPNGIDVRVTFRKKGFKTDNYTINPSINTGKTIEYELHPELQQSLSHSSKTIYLPPKVSHPVKLPQTFYQNQPLPSPTSLSTSISLPFQVPSSKVKTLKSSYKNDELALLDGYTIEIFF
jgi:hypothetical protein